MICDQFQHATFTGARAGCVLALTRLCRYGAMVMLSGTCIPGAAQTSPDRASPTKPSFEVASVKPKTGLVYRSAIEISGARVSASGPLIHLIALAYNVKRFQIVGGPAWAKSGETLFEIVAKVGEDVTLSAEGVRQMMQSLLSERFQLRLRSDVQTMTAYRLTVAKNGARLKESAPESRFGLSVKLGPVSTMVATALPISSFCNQLNGYIADRPVLDGTALAGKYDFTLEWSPNGEPIEGSAAPSIFTAVEEQLGLKLQLSHVPLDVLIIERVERPSEN